MLIVKTPAKLILSGEHAVVHGYPALAIAVNRYITLSLKTCSKPGIFFTFKTLNMSVQTDIVSLKLLKAQLYERYALFREGDLDLQKILDQPTDLLLFAFINLFEKHSLDRGVELILESSIPLSSGMGSSAATIVAITFALDHLLNLSLTKKAFVRYGIEAENLQHGYSSGIDIYTVLEGGLLRFENRRVEKRKINLFPFQLVQTGERQCTTADCVAHSVPFFKDPGFGMAFADITNAFDLALQDNKLDDLRICIRENQSLLRTIKVVPNKVHDFIHRIEKRGGAAKICGAGSITGDTAGVVLVLLDVDISDLVADFNYTVIPVEPDLLGARLVSNSV